MILFKKEALKKEIIKRIMRKQTLLETDWRFQSLVVHFTTFPIRGAEGPTRDSSLVSILH